MAKSKFTRARAQKAAADRPPTAAERNRAIRHLQKFDGAHVPMPPNCLIQDTPANTIGRCRGIVNWLAHIEQPFTGDALDAAEADVLQMVTDALRHAEQVLRSIGSIADAEVAHG